jgi:hypothetical protein
MLKLVVIVLQKPFHIVTISDERDIFFYVSKCWGYVNSLEAKNYDLIMLTSSMECRYSRYCGE